ncbi:MAG TPA: response regulator [Terriglobales bacterium]|nr:response regulator [Terriglobales bacterium]
MRSLAVLFLEEEQFCVLQACNGDEALRIARTQDRIDLLLTDVEMGDSPDGIDVASVILAERPGLSVLVMSGFPDSERKALEKGFAFVAKPFTGTSLRQRVREILASKLPPQSETRANLRTGDKSRAVC